jgi:hypothetical protein
MPYGRPKIRVLRTAYPTANPTPKKRVQNRVQYPDQNERLEPEWSVRFTGGV